MPTKTRQSPRRRPAASEHERDRATFDRHNRVRLTEELPGLPISIATGEDPVILAALVAVWLDSEGASDA